MRRDARGGTTRGRRHGLLAALALTLQSPGTAYGADGAASRAELEQVETDLDSVETRIETRQIEITANQQALRTLEGALAATDREQQTLQERRSTLQASLAASREAVAEAGAALDTAAQQLTAELAQIANLSRRPAPLSVLAGAAATGDEPPTPAADMALLRHFGLARARLLRRWQDSEDRHRAEIARLEALGVELDGVEAGLAENRGRLERQRRERAALIARLDAALGEDLSVREALLATRARLTDLVESLERRAAADRPFSDGRGRLPWPVTARPTNRFGRARGDAGLRWEGVMLPAAEGDPVRAIAPGTVAFADTLRGYGLLVILDHGDGYLSLYAHHASLAVTPGERVDGGDVIARAGRSGGLENAAVYFEIRKDGEPRDPGEWCTGADA